MRILWICDLVLPEFSKEYNIKQTCYGGWMSGMLLQLEQVKDLVVGLCFPIKDAERMKNSVHGSHPFYSFHASMDFGDYHQDGIEEFLNILKDFKPDIIHIWGTEYNHAKAAMDACIRLNMRERVLIHIQGLVSYYSFHYLLGIDHEVLSDTNYRSLLEDKWDFVKRGNIEEDVLRQSYHVCDCSEWGKLCTELINPTSRFYYCDDVLRKSFYEEKAWNTKSYRPHSIFMSQGNYPVKGLHFLLRAIPIIKRIYDDVVVYISGRNLTDSKNDPSGYARYIRNIIKTEGIDENVVFIGALSETEMVVQYLKANVFVSPSTIEDPSNSICEAMVLGVPVVASYVGGTPSLIRHGIDGFLYPCDAHYMLAYYIMQIFKDDELAGRISSAAMENARKRHDPEKIKNRMMEIYHSIALA